MGRRLPTVALVRAEPRQPRARPAPPWTSEHVFHDGDSFFDGLLRQVDRAQRSVDGEVYIYEDDALGRRVAESLVAASRRGVRVRFMVDGVGSPQWASRFLADLLGAGVDARVYRPLPWLFLDLGRWRAPPLLWLLKALLAANRRNHRKVWIVDGTVAWLGSMNVSAEHLSVPRGGQGWRDTGVRVKGPQVEMLAWALQKSFRKAWRFRRAGRHYPAISLTRKPPLTAPLVRLNDRVRARLQGFNDLLRRIKHATRRVWLTTPYFVPSGRLLRRLRGAACRGVDVRIILSRQSDHWFMRWVATSFYRVLLDSGVRVLEYKPSILHAKTTMVDDWVLVGSSNLNHRSLIHDLEVDVVLTAERARMSVDTQFLLDQEQCEEMTVERLERTSWLGRTLGRALLLFRYWM
jgi:cardiolipin synthase